MAATTVYKPATNDGNPAFLADVGKGRTPPVLILADGTRITGTLKSSNAESSGRNKWIFPPSVLGQEGATIEFGGQSYPIENTSKAMEGTSPSDWKDRGGKGDIGSAGSSGIQPGLGAGTVGEFGVAPAYIGDQFPEAVQTQYDPIEGAAASYQYVDPIKFGKEFTPFQRQQIGESFAQAKGLSLDAIDTEFQGLNSFVSKSAGLKRDQVGQDNSFNQAQRTQQVNTALPDVVADINKQAEDARIYASGRLPDSVQDAALELGIRSDAADSASAGGFGALSGASRKASDLMSARERTQLAFQGQGLLSKNIADRENLFLAPTEYSDAGGQIRVSPTVSGSQLQQQNASDIQNQVGIRSETAYQGTINQAQFGSNLIQRTQEFNASNTLQNDQFNATNLNNFALSFFNYLNSYVNSVAGATQTNVNTGIAIDQQSKAQDEANKQKKKTQDANAIAGGGGVIGGIIGILSDRRLKENVTPYENGLEHLLALPVFEYTYKPKTIAFDGGRKHVGVMAQELQTNFPNSVGKHESGYLQIDPAELIYALIQAVQVLHKKIDSLERYK